MGAVMSKLFLLSGADLRITKTVTVKHPTVTDVLALNNGYFCEELYWSYVSALMSDPYDYMVYLDDQGLDYEKYSSFQVFVLRWQDAQIEKLTKKDEAADMMFDAMTFFFGAHDFDVVVLDGQQYLVDKKDYSWVMNEQVFDMAINFIFELNCLERTDKIKPATPGHKRILIEDMRAEQKRKLKNKKPPEQVSHIGDALSAVLSGGSGAITPATCSSTHIYQLLSSSKAIQKKMVVQSLLNGIYTGMIKADKITNEEMRWA